MPQPNPTEITDMLNSVLQPQGVTAKALVKEGCLHILLEGEQTPEKEQYVALVHDEILNSGVDSVPTLQIYGRQMGAKKPSWSETIDLLQSRDNEEDLPNFALDDSDDEVDSYNHHSPDSAEPNQTGKGSTPKMPISKLLPLLAIPLLAIIGGALWWVFLRPGDAPITPASAPETSPEPSATETSPSPVPASPASAPPSANPWRDGINMATSAAQLALQAKDGGTRAQWEEVARQWQMARDFMSQVPEGDPNYAAAQDRVISYGENANSALIWADRSQ